MNKNRSRLWPVVTIVVAVYALLITLPESYRQWAPGFIKDPKIHFGLDLAGGTQLDFRISEREMREQEKTLEEELQNLENSNAPAEEINTKRVQLQAIREQQQGIVEAIRTVLERRVNALGVSEAVITPSYIGDEKHLLVECPGVVDTQVCIETVGKTIKLEFKEEFTEPTEEYEEGIREQADESYARIQSGDVTLATIGEDLSSEVGIVHQGVRQYFQSELSGGTEVLWDMSPDDGVQLIEGHVIVPDNSSGEMRIHEVSGIYLAQVTDEKVKANRKITNPLEAMEHLSEIVDGAELIEHGTRVIDDSIPSGIIAALRTMEPGATKAHTSEDGSSILYLRGFTEGKEEASASHILIAYQGAVSSDESVTRSKEEAEAFAAELRQELEDGADFAALALEHSNGPSGKEGGSLGTFGRGQMVPPFEAVAFGLAESEIGEIVETQFGFHIIKADADLSQTEDQATYEELTFGSDTSAEKVENYLTQIQEGTLEVEEDAISIETIFFSFLPSGWKDTALDGKHFRSATVTLDGVTNLPVVQIMFDDEGAKLFQELTKENIGKRIAIFVGGDLVSAPNVQSEIAGGIAVITGAGTFEEAKALATDLNTGAIPAPIYLTGQRTVEATLGAEALRTSLQAALIGIVILMIYMLLVYRFLGLLANIALAFYAIIFFAFLKLPLFLFSDQQVVLSLAGMAGIILSIGMAVDANVLIFERLKEELRKGKLLSTAADTGFNRAWPSIRDGNVSTFITCFILFTIGTSIIRGFAVTLGMGVLISMFSAIVITRWLIRQVAKTPLSEKTALFGVKNNG